MIGKITTGTSFYHCISYCLHDKKNLSEEEKLRLSERDNLQHKDRAEVLFYNNCFGNARELANQFKEVRQLSCRVEKPVLHISLTLGRVKNSQRIGLLISVGNAQKNSNSTKTNISVFYIKTSMNSTFISWLIGSDMMAKPLA